MKGRGAGKPSPLGSSLKSGSKDLRGCSKVRHHRRSLSACDLTPSSPFSFLFLLPPPRRAADGDEGGRHQLIKATVSNGNLYILKVQCGDKRWFKGVKVEAEGAFNSFIVA